MIENRDKLVARQLKLAKARPLPPRDVRFDAGTLRWTEPANTSAVTHYLVRVGSDASAPRYKVAAGQTAIPLAAGDTKCWVSAWNEPMQMESVKVFSAGETGDTGGVMPNVTNIVASIITPSQFYMQMTVTATAPVAASFHGAWVILEVPADSDPTPANPTLPGTLLPFGPFYHPVGAGGTWIAEFPVFYPLRAEKWIVYVLPLGAAYTNTLVRLSAISPPTPADATPWVALDISAATVAQSGLVDNVTLTGDPTLYWLPDGSLRITQLYVPPYIPPYTSQNRNIGDFQGVVAAVEYADGTVKILGEQPYTADEAADPPANLGTATFEIPKPDPQTLWIHALSYSTTFKTGYKSHATAPVQTWKAVVIDAAAIQNGSAPQVTGFTVQVEQQALSGVDEGGKQNRFKFIFTKPVSDKWKEVWIEKIKCNSSFVPVPGEVWVRVAALLDSPGYSDWWPIPTLTEYWTFRARSVNFADEANSTSYPQEFVILTGEGTFILARNAVTEQMLADLAVTARALADQAVTTAKYAPLSINSAAIGLLAVNDAHIENLNVSKLTGNTMILTGGLTVQDATYTYISLTTSGGTILGPLTIYNGGIWNGTPTFTGGLEFNIGYFKSISGDGAAVLKSLTLDTALAVAYGGTGATTAGGALTNLGAASATHDHAGVYAPVSHTHSWADITSGTQPQPPTHASSHAAAGSDPVSITIAQISDEPTPAADGTYSNPTSITISKGRITAIS